MASIGGQVAHALNVGFQTAQELYGGSKREAKVQWVEKHADFNPRYGAVFSRETQRTALERVMPFAKWARDQLGATRINQWSDDVRLAYVRHKVESGEWRSRASVEGFWSSSTLVMQCAARAYPGSCAGFAYNRLTGDGKPVWSESRHRLDTAIRNWREQRVTGFERISPDSHSYDHSKLRDRRTWFTMQDVARLATHMDRHCKPANALGLQLAALTGMRAGRELIQIRLHQCRLVDGRLIIHDVIGKGGRVRVVRSLPLPPEVHQRLERILATGSPQHRLLNTSYQGMQKSLQRACRATGTHEYGLHGLRRLYARELTVELRRAGLDRKTTELEVAQALGHGRSMAAHYPCGDIHDAFDGRV